MGSRQIVLVSTAGISVLNAGIFWREAKTKRLFSQCKCPAKFVTRYPDRYHNSLQIKSVLCMPAWHKKTLQGNRRAQCPLYSSAKISLHSPTPLSSGHNRPLLGNRSSIQIVCIYIFLMSTQAFKSC
jgi:hypothetical protein